MRNFESQGYGDRGQYVVDVMFTEELGGERECPGGKFHHEFHSLFSQLVKIASDDGWGFDPVGYDT